MVVAATAYIKADSEEEARKEAESLKGSVINLTSSSEVEVSDLQFDDPNLPDVSISPVATCQGPDPAFEPDVVHVGD